MKFVDIWAALKAALALTGLSKVVPLPKKTEKFEKIK